MSNCLDLARDYIRAFCAGDIDRLTPLLADDFVIQGPLYRFESAAAFLDRLKTLNAPAADCQLLSLQGDDGSASAFFNYRIGPMTLLMAMQFTARDNQLGSALLVFDTAKLPGR